MVFCVINFDFISCSLIYFLYMKFLNMCRIMHNLLVLLKRDNVIIYIIKKGGWWIGIVRCWDTNLLELSFHQFQPNLYMKYLTCEYISSKLKIRITLSKKSAIVMAVTIARLQTVNRSQSCLLLSLHTIRSNKIRQVYWTIRLMALGTSSWKQSETSLFLNLHHEFASS